MYHNNQGRERKKERFHQNQQNQQNNQSTHDLMDESEIQYRISMTKLTPQQRLALTSLDKETCQSLGTTRYVNASETKSAYCQRKSGEASSFTTPQKIYEYIMDGVPIGSIIKKYTAPRRLTHHSYVKYTPRHDVELSIDQFLQEYYDQNYFKNENKQEQEREREREREQEGDDNRSNNKIKFSNNSPRNVKRQPQIYPSPSSPNNNTKSNINRRLPSRMPKLERPKRSD